MGQRQDLVSGILDCPGFVDVHVAGVCRNHAFIVFEHGRNDRRISLCAAHQKFDLCVQAAAGFADLILRAFAVVVRTIAGEWL